MSLGRGFFFFFFFFFFWFYFGPFEPQHMGIPEKGVPGERYDYILFL